MRRSEPKRSRMVSRILSPALPEPIGAVIPDKRNAPVKVVVFQWPWGTAARQRSPRLDRPRNRAILVVAPVWSMKTSRSRSRSGCSSNQIQRLSATSGRCCSAACAVFFKSDPPPVEETPQRCDTDWGTALPHERLEFSQGDVRRHLDLGQQEISMGFNARGSSVATLRLGFGLALVPPRLHPADRARYADPKSGGGLTP